MANLFGKFRAVVTGDRDPVGGRVRVAVPALGGTESVWAEPCLPLTAEGTYVVPPVGTAVWVEFEGGDVNFPILCGRMWDRAGA